ncbi:MAG: hypothetical protein KA397_01835 [Paludibacteraceae bacterium]|nr:hypothetical protein [Paludibacteraceae bacterium]MBP6284286.1 hypothetical protein [Paludibacteraceae bacterium]
MPSKFLYILLLSITLVACDKIVSIDAERVAVMSVNEQVLYLDEIEKILPENITGKDSTNFIETYKKNWAVNILLREKAQQNIRSTEEIDRLTEEYRTELIINLYKQELISQKLKNIKEEAIMAVYEDEKHNFILEEPIIKGVFVQVPSKAPNQKQLRKWMLEMNDKTLEKIEKYCIQYASSYIFFREEWTPYQKVDKLFPYHVDWTDPILTRGLVEQQDSSSTYFLRITGRVNPGTIEPFEIAQQKIIDILSHREKMNYIKEFENTLYNNAIKKEKITFFLKTEK